MSENPKNKKRVIVLFGGRADEHSISCISAGSLLRAIDRDRFEPIPVAIAKEGQWVLPDVDPRGWNLGDGAMPEVNMTDGSRPVMIDMAKGADGFFALLPGDNKAGSAAIGVGVSGDMTAGDVEDTDCEWLGHIDAVFPVLHGEYGEDGAVQGLLETLGVPYVGCGVLASAVCMDKHFTKILLRAAGIAVTPGVTFDARPFDQSSRFEANAGEILDTVAAAGLRYPLFVKPAWGGSSFGVTKVERQEDLVAAVYAAYPYSWRILVEQGIEGREIECAVLSTNPLAEPRTAWPGEIVLDHKRSEGDEFYDFDAKYTDSSASHVEVPAKLPTEMLQKVRDVAARAFKAVDGAGLMRVDTFVQEDGTVMVNEINTMPGFTSISMYPKAWAASGIEYQKVITELIDSVAR